MKRCSKAEILNSNSCTKPVLLSMAKNLDMVFTDAFTKVIKHFALVIAVIFLLKVRVQELSCLKRKTGKKIFDFMLLKLSTVKYLYCFTHTLNFY